MSAQMDEPLGRYRRSKHRGEVGQVYLEYFVVQYFLVNFYFLNNE
jgi:hypothetical protein